MSWLDRVYAEMEEAITGLRGSGWRALPEDAQYALGLRGYSDLKSAMRHYGGPAGEQAGAALDVLPYLLGPGANVQDMTDGSSELSAGIRDGDIGRGAQGLAQLLGGGAGVFVPGLSMAMFLGPTAKTADLTALNRAQDMARKGADERAIWDETGWFQGADGKWRFEIDDSGAEFLDQNLPAAEGVYDLAGRWYREQGFDPKWFATGQYPDMDRQALEWAKENIATARAPEVPLGDVMRHDALFSEYDDLADIAVAQQRGGGAAGSYSADRNRMTLGGELLGGSSRSTALHELQHGVQGREGFARGGSPDAFASEVLDDVNRRISSISENMNARERELGLSGYRPKTDDATLLALRDEYDALMDSRGRARSHGRDGYRRLAGEVEARNVQTRRDYTPEQRRASPPWETEDVPRDRQIVRFR